MAEFPAPAEGIVLTHFIVASDVGRARRFYADVLGGEVLREGEPSIVALANSWIVINVGGPPAKVNLSAKACVARGLMPRQTLARAPCPATRHCQHRSRTVSAASRTTTAPNTLHRVRRLYLAGPWLGPSDRLKHAHDHDGLDLCTQWPRGRGRARGP